MFYNTVLLCSHLVKVIYFDVSCIANSSNLIITYNNTINLDGVEFMEISFKDIIAIIKKSIIFIIITSINFALATFFITNFFVPKTYTASVKLYVKTTYETTSNNEGLSAYNYASRLVDTYIQMLDTTGFYSDVAENLNNKYTSAQIASMVSFTSIDGTDLFKATVVSKSPTEAKNIADAVTQTAPKRMSSINNDTELKIIDEASVPRTPTSPNVKRNTYIAFIIGLVVSLIIAFIRDYFDVNIKYDDEMTTLCNLPVLAAIPDFELFVDNALSRSADKGNSSSVKY